MDKLLKPQVFDCEPNVPEAEKQWKHWIKKFETFCLAAEKANSSTDPFDKLPLLVHYLSTDVHELIWECNTYTEAKNVLENAYLKPKSEVYARYMLITRKQENSESIDQYFTASSVDTIGILGASALPGKQNAITARKLDISRERASLQKRMVIHLMQLP